jgi:hypothetical protein
LNDLNSEASLKADIAAAVPEKDRIHLASALNSSKAKCIEPIAAIEGRGLISNDPEISFGPAQHPSTRTSRYAAVHLDSARHAATGSNPSACLNTLRMFVEAICDDLFVRWKVWGEISRHAGAEAERP